MYPSKVIQNARGGGLPAAADLADVRGLARFERPLVRFRDIPEVELFQAPLVRGDDRLVPQANVRFPSHLCALGCVALDAATLRAVRGGEDLTNRHNAAELEALIWDPDRRLWDTRWSFLRQCGLPQCAGMIDGHVFKERAKAGATGAAMARS